MKKCLLILSFACMLQLSETVKGQIMHVFAHDLDSSEYDWTAMASTHVGLIISTQPKGSLMTPKTGDIRLRVYPPGNIAPGNLLPATHTFRYQAKARVMSMESAWGLLYLAGGYNDTTILGNDTLLAQDPWALDPFLAAVDPNTGQVVWTWHRPASQNNFIHRVRHHNGQIICSGLADDVSGWAAAFDAQSGALLWEKTFPGLRTLSDAAIDPAFPGSLLITGTVDDNGFLNQQPVPVSPPATGYRTFLARYYPDNDSANFIESLPYITFDFSPAFTKVFRGITAYSWTAPLVSNSIGGMGQVRWKMWGMNWRDTLSHDMYYLPLECSECSNGSTHIEWMSFYKTPGINPNLYSLTYEDGPIGQLAFSMGTQTEALGTVFPAGFHLAFESSGSLDIQPIAGWLPDTLLMYANATPTQRKWVLFSGGIIPANVTEQQTMSATIYPNPVRDGQFSVRLSTPAASPLPWILHDIKGKAVLNGELSESEDLIVCPDLKPGLYFFEIQSPQGRSVQKMIVQ
jgi:hypothetical protein